jgi:hypothetical protein
MHYTELGLDPKRASALIDMVAAKLPWLYFDEGAIEYEAERLSRHAIVLVFVAEESEPTLIIAKDDGECVRYLRGEIPNVEFEAVIATNSQAAIALRAAILRRSGKTYLRVVK